MKLLDLPDEILEIIYNKTKVQFYICENYGYESLAYCYKYSLMANLCKTNFYEKKKKIEFVPVRHKEFFNT